MGDEESRKNRRCVGDDPVETLPPAVRPGRLPLEGASVLLEPLDPRLHGAELFAIGHRGSAALDLWRYLPNGPFVDGAAMSTWLRGCAASADPLFFVPRHKESARLMGMAAFLDILPTIGVVEIGHIWFAPPFQRTIQATEALSVMIHHAMDDLACRRLEWKCNALNHGSRKAALRLGFRFEGVFYNHNIVKGRNRDTAWYSMLDSEWPQVRRNIQAWLDPGNFDASGRQRSSLSDLNRTLWAVP